MIEMALAMGIVVIMVVMMMMIMMMMTMLMMIMVTAVVVCVSVSIFRPRIVGSQICEGTCRVAPNMRRIRMASSPSTLEMHAFVLGT